ncbi:MAG: SDR family NAD(P)-dependent oxidoreductase [Acidobacteriota bacterium]
MANADPALSRAVAVISMVGRFPGARDVESLWQNLRQGRESVAFFSPDEMRQAGVDPAVVARSDYVPARGILEQVERFDAEFFGFSPREAEIMDPQHRLMLEYAWEALELAGYPPTVCSDPVGIFVGKSANTYWRNNLATHPELAQTLGEMQLSLGNDADFLATNVAYKLDARGPCVTVQTACSTSLVASCMAVSSLLSYQCDIALAGGVTVAVPQQRGYLYQKGSVGSPDGRCRPFDASAGGSIPGNGIGLVVLKRLSDALADGDAIQAVIRGAAINNDGSLKAGFTAPSQRGQAEVIALAQALAGVSADSIGYVETHGTGTALGDPIEIAALNQVLASPAGGERCAIGSIKSNFGHLDAAAGVAGLIKSALTVQHGEIPPSLGFETPNPEIDFANGAVAVNTRLRPWPESLTPRRAAVSSFGIGGTNAHMILEQAPEPTPSGPSRPHQLLMLSAKTATALDAATDNLARHLEQQPEQHLADVAYTLQVGRASFEHRRFAVCSSHEDAAARLSEHDPDHVLEAVQSTADRPVAFMFPGLGDQYVGMSRELYHSETVFRSEIDRCAELLEPLILVDFRKLLYAEESEAPAEATTDLRRMLGRSRRGDSAAGKALHRTAIAHPMMFAVEYALAKQWMAWGIEPQAMIGYSLGEYVAACIAGVFSLPDALTLVARRAAMIEALPEGAMLAVPLGEDEVQRLLGPEVSLAAINGPPLSVLSGSEAGIASVESRLLEEGVLCRRLETTHAFHSWMMAPLVEPLTQQVSSLQLERPRIPYLSNVTGTWITDEEATDPAYWSKILCQSVRFGAGLAELWQEPGRILLELGPGQALGSLALQHPGATSQEDPVVLSSLRSGFQSGSDVEFALRNLGLLWLAGKPIDWAGFYADEQRHRVPLPTYPFERREHWIEPAHGMTMSAVAPQTVAKRSPDEWLYVPSWKRTPVPTAEPPDNERPWLVLGQGDGFGLDLPVQLMEAGRSITMAVAGERFERGADGRFTFRLDQPGDYDELLEAVIELGGSPPVIVHCLNATATHETSSSNTLSSSDGSPSDGSPSDGSPKDRSPKDRSPNDRQALGLYSLLYLVQALARHHLTDPVRLEVITSGLWAVHGHEPIVPELATLLGATTVVPQELPHVACRVIDVDAEDLEVDSDRVVRWLLLELGRMGSESQLAYRRGQRWARVFEPLHAGEIMAPPIPLRRRGVVMITGGFGRAALVLAEHLATSYSARLVLLGRTELPPEDRWQEWLEGHPADDPVSVRIEAVERLRAAGAEVLPLAADVADPQRMNAVVREVLERFGALDGVLHTAGVLEDDGFPAVQHTGPQQCALHFRSKLEGTQVLAEALAGRELDFCMLFSSLSTVLGGLGYSAYVAANAFQDAFAESWSRHTGVPWISVDWDSWPQAETDPEAPSGTTSSTLAELIMTREEAATTFERILASGATPRYVVSLGDLETRRSQWTATPDSQEAGEQAAGESPQSSHPRPNLRTAYVAPRSDSESLIVEVWQQVLGIEGVGVHDNFFQLGGHSLLGTQLTARLRETFRVDLPVRAIFDHPTVAGLEQVISKLETQRTDEEEVELLLEGLGDLPRDELEALLSGGSLIEQEK